MAASLSGKGLAAAGAGDTKSNLRPCALVQDPMVRAAKDAVKPDMSQPTFDLPLPQSSSSDSKLDGKSVICNTKPNVNCRLSDGVSATQ
jgi:hypothetical protein